MNFVVLAELFPDVGNSTERTYASQEICLLDFPFFLPMLHLGLSPEPLNAIPYECR